MALLWKSSFIHEHYTVDRQVELLMTALSLHSPGEHYLDLIGRGTPGTLVIVGIQGVEDVGITKQDFL